MMKTSMEEALYIRKQSARMKRYIKTPRPLIFLFSLKYLTPTAFGLYMYLAMYAGFDSRNSQYGVIELKTSELASLLGFNIKTIQTNLKKLSQINAIQFTKDNYISITNYETLFVKTKETFPKNEDALFLLENYFSINSQNNSNKQKYISTVEKNISNQTLNNDNQIKEQTPYTVSSYKVSKVNNNDEEETDDNDYKRIKYINGDKYEHSQGTWMKVDKFTDEELDDISEKINEDVSNW